MKYHKPRRPKTNRYKRVTLRSKMKDERKKATAKMLLYGLLLGLTVFTSMKAWNAATGFLFESDNFKIRKIEIKGAKNVTQGEIIALLPFRVGDNMFNAWVKKAEENLRQYKPELKNVSVSRGWKKIVVSVEERMPIAVVLEDGIKLGIDTDNKPFHLRGPFAKKPLPELVCAGQNERKEALKFIGDFAPEAKEIYPKVVKITVESCTEIKMHLKDGPAVLWGSNEKEKIRNKLNKLRQVMKDAVAKYKIIEYINMAFYEDGRIIVKPKVNA